MIVLYNGCCNYNEINYSRGRCSISVSELQIENSRDATIAARVPAVCRLRYDLEYLEVYFRSLLLKLI